jgi:hypothetical protein
MKNSLRDGTLGRRGFLALTASGVSALLTGCADPRSVLVLEEATDEEIGDTAEEVEPGSDEAEVITDAVGDGNATHVGTGRVPPMGFSSPLLHNGTYYDTEVRSETVSEDTEYVLRVEYAGDEPIENETDYDALPEPDRDALSDILPPEEPEGFDDETGRLYTEEERDDSLLVGRDSPTVVLEGTRYTVETDRGETVDRREYTYRFEVVAEARDGYVSWMKDEFTFTLEGLSDGERAVVEEAIDGGYYEGSSAEEFVSLVERFREHRAVRSDEWGGEWLVEYDGTVYLADLRHSPSAIG